MPAAERTPTAPPQRLVSVDALRGFDMFWIVGGAEVVQAFAHWAGFRYAGELDDQLEHVAWEGFHFEDLIFPLFLFLVGVAIPLSLGKLTGPGVSRPAAHWRIFRRTVVLFALGLVYYNFLQFDFANQRYVGVLQRIAVCYGITALIALHTGVRTQVVLVAAILAGYWALLTYVPAPGGTAGDLSPEGNLAGYLDRHFLPGKIFKDYYGFGDNEGYLSTIPAIATTLIGVPAGRWLKTPRPVAVKALALAVAGAACLAGGYYWGQTFPIIKILWTSSFVLVAAGWSLLLLALFHLVIDGLGLKRWAYFFVVIGSNAILAYFVHRVLENKGVGQGLADFFFGGLYKMPTPEWLGGLLGSIFSLLRFQPAGPFLPVAHVLGGFALLWVFLWWLHRNRLYLRA
jgi:predicted acyltransferase